MFMQVKKIILKPVSPASYKPDFNAAAAGLEVQPEILFADTIRQVEKFSAGRFFWFIADTRIGVATAAGGMLESMLPVAMKDFIHHPPTILFQQIHPEDAPKMFAFSEYWTRFFTGLPMDRRKQVSPSIYIRLMSKEGSYKWMMVQYCENIFNQEDLLVYGFTLVTDISHIKTDGPAMMSILDLQDQSCRLFFCSEHHTIEDVTSTMPKITPRELEVLKLLIAGQSSKQIAALLHTAVKTIDNHRQRMLKKTNTKSTGELVAYAITLGYV